MSDWRIQYVDAVGVTQEVTFPELAALENGKVVSDGWEADFVSHRASSLQLNLPGVPPHQAPAIPFESRISILDPADVIQFQGFRTDRTGAAEPRRANSAYTFEDEWYFLEHCVYYQVWSRVTDSTPGAMVSTSFPYTNVVLFQPNPGQTYTPAIVDGRINTGQQIKDILNWAIAMGANLQIGTIDPASYCAVYPVQNINCADAIRLCLRIHPDCYTEIDYSTTPPTFHVRQRGNLTSVTLPYSYTDADGRRHTASNVQPLPHLRARRVALFYRVISSGYLLSTPMDIYPNSTLSCTGPISAGQLVGGSAAPYTAGGTPIVGTAMENLASGTADIQVGAAGGLRALDYAIDLQGPRSTLVSAQLTSAAFDPTNLTWWKKKMPSLVNGIPTSGTGALTLISSTVNGGGSKDISVKDDAGANIDIGTFAYELDPQSAVMSWMTGVQVKWATITAYFTYSKATTIGDATLSREIKEHQQHLRVKLTNVPSSIYTLANYLTSGEAVPGNLAQQIYTALDWLQYKLTHRIVELPFNGWIKPGKHAINLAGGSTDWETMNACVQHTTYRMHLDGAGNTFDNFDVQCGPVAHLEAGQLVQLFNVFYNRDLTKIDTNERSSGLPAQGMNVNMPDDHAQENSIPAESVPDTNWHAYEDGSGNLFGVKISASDIANINALG